MAARNKAKTAKIAKKRGEQHALSLMDRLAVVAQQYGKGERELSEKEAK